ncbi:unnamed protein product [Chrysoparadoxa australica]
MPSALGPVFEALSAGSNPLLQTLVSFERQLMLALNKGETLSSMAQQRQLRSRAALEEARTQISSLHAALSNLGEHKRFLGATITLLIETLKTQEIHHEGLLESFERDVEALKAVSLHPALVHPDQGLTTLLDCVSLDEKREAHAKGLESHRKMAEHRDKLLNDWSSIRNDTDLLERDSQDYLAGVQAVEAELEGRDGADVVAKQASCLKMLECHYEQALEVASQLLKAGVSSSGVQGLSGSSLALGAIHTLNDLSNEQADAVPTMEAGDASLVVLERKAYGAKATASSILLRRLRQVSSLQDRMQAARSRAKLLQVAHKEKEEQFQELTSLRCMPAAYEAFLLEVARRKSFTRVFGSRVEDALEAIAALRSTEILARDRFMSDHLVHLPPVIVEGSPGLTAMPPNFSPTTSIMIPDPASESLPDVEGAHSYGGAALAESLREEVVGEGVNTAEGSIILDGTQADTESNLDALKYENALLQAELLRYTGRQLPLADEGEQGGEEEARGLPEVPLPEGRAASEVTAHEPHSPHGHASTSEGLALLQQLVQAWLSEQKDEGELEEELGLVELKPTAGTATPEGKAWSADRIAAVIRKARLKTSEAELQLRGEQEGLALPTLTPAPPEGYIKICDFQPGDFALFLLSFAQGSSGLQLEGGAAEAKKLYIAFTHKRQKSYILAEESMDPAWEAEERYPIYILALITAVLGPETEDVPDDQPGPSPTQTFHLVADIIVAPL